MSAIEFNEARKPTSQYAWLSIGKIIRNEADKALFLASALELQGADWNIRLRSIRLVKLFARQWRSATPSAETGERW